MPATPASTDAERDALLAKFHAQAAKLAESDDAEIRAIYKKRLLELAPQLVALGVQATNLSEGNLGITVQDSDVRDVIQQITINLEGSTEPRPLIFDVPVDTHRLVGRDAIIEDIVARFTSGNAVSLATDGQGGIGKTALAIRIANDTRVLSCFVDGVLWCSVGPNRLPGATLVRWCQALEINVTHPQSDADTARDIKNAIGTRKFLLVLDDIWRDQDATLLCECAGLNCGVLLTTRVSSVAAAVVHPVNVIHVPVLTEGAPEELLRELAPKAFAANEEVATKLAQQAGGLPIMLSLIAAYLAPPSRSVFEDTTKHALAELSDVRQRLSLAKERLGADDDSPMTISEVVRLSLSDFGDAVTGRTPNAAHIFDALGAFAPKPAFFDLEAAQYVTETQAKTLALFVDRALIERDQQTGQLAIHQVIAEVARQRTPDSAWQRHSEHYMARVKTYAEDATQWQQIQGLYAQAYWAMGQAAELGDDHAALMWIALLRNYARRRGLQADRLALWQRQADICRTNDIKDGLAAALDNIGSIYAELGDLGTALSYFDQALPITHDIQDRSGEAATLTNKSNALRDLHRLHDALTTAKQAQVIQTEIGDHHGLATTFNNIGLIFHTLEQLELALDYLTRSIDVPDGLDDLRAAATRVAREQVRLELAKRQVSPDPTANAEAEPKVRPDSRQDALIEACTIWLRISRDKGDRPNEAAALNALATAHAESGDLMNARKEYADVLTVWRELRRPSEVAVVLRNLGNVEAELGEPPQSQQHYDEAIQLYRQMNDRSGEANVYTEVGNQAEARSAWSQAQQAYARACQIYHDEGDVNAEATLQLRLGQVALESGNPAQSKDFYAMARTLFQAPAEGPVVEGDNTNSPVQRAHADALRGQAEAANGVGTAEHTLPQSCADH